MKKSGALLIGWFVVSVIFLLALEAFTLSDNVAEPKAAAPPAPAAPQGGAAPAPGGGGMGPRLTPPAGGAKRYDNQ